jgi:type III secretion protein T
MDATTTTMALLSSVYPMLVAAAIATARALGIVMVSPAFTRLGLTGLLRTSVAVVIALPVLPTVLDVVTTTQLSSAVIAGLLAKEMLIGALVGLAFGVPFWAAEAAGDLVDLQRGSTAAQLLDPLALAESNITGTLLTIVLLALFFMTGGFSLLLRGFYDSYGLWSATSFAPALGPDSIATLLRLLDRIMQIAVLMVAPIVIGLLLADIALGFLSRLTPQFHVFDLSLAVKNLLFTFLIAVYAVFLVPFMLSEIGALNGAFDVLRRMAEGRSP